MSRVVAITRRALPPHPRLENPIVNFDALDENAPWWKPDAVICMLGTTMWNAGSKEAFRRVDFDYALTAARLARRKGTPTFVLNSSVGADPKARGFYLKVKGELEQALSGEGFNSLTFVRPSLLMGDRAEFRRGERAAIVFARIFRPVIPRRYRAVHADRVAAALINAALHSKPGTHIVESENI